MTTQKYYKVGNVDDGEVIDVIGTTVERELIDRVAREHDLYLEEIELFSFGTSETGAARERFVERTFLDRYGRVPVPEPKVLWQSDDKRVVEVGPDCYPELLRNKRWSADMSDGEAFDIMRLAFLDMCPPRGWKE